MSGFQDDPDEPFEMQDAYGDRERAGAGRAEEGTYNKPLNKEDKRKADRIKRHGTDSEKFVELIDIALKRLEDEDINIKITSDDIDTIKNKLDEIPNLSLKNPLGLILGFKGRSMDVKTINALIKTIDGSDNITEEYGIVPADIVRYSSLWYTHTI